MKTCKKSLLLAGGLLIGLSSANAQYLRSAYFMEGTSSRLQLNPGLQPMRGYFNVPFIGSFNVGAYSNVLGVEDIKDILDSGDKLYNNDKLYSRLKKENHLNVNFNTDILSLGWYKGKGFWSVNVGLRADVDANIQKNMFEYMRQVDAASQNGINTLADICQLNGSFQNMHLNVNVWTEIGLGYSRPVNDKLTVGGRLKVLLGLARAEMKIDNFSFDAQCNSDLLANKTFEQIQEEINSGHLNENTPLGHVKYAVDAEVSTSLKGSGLKYNQDGSISGFDVKAEDLGIAGAGFGIDLGATYKILDNVTVSAAVLDLGFIKWKGNSTTMAKASESSNEAITVGNYQEISDKYTSSDFLNLDRFNLSESSAESQKSYKKKLASTILLGGEYDMFNHKLGFGAMYTARFVQPITMHEVTFSATYRPKNWFNVALSYSPVQASGKSFGLAMKLGPLFIGTDYMFFGNNTKSVNGFLGLSIPLGKSKTSFYSVP